jgi:hypothetical protein
LHAVGLKLEDLPPSVASKVEAGRILFLQSAAAELNFVA